MGEDFAKVVGAHLANEAGLAAEAGDTRNGVSRGATRHFERGVHSAVDLVRFGQVHQRHATLGQAELGVDVVVVLHDDV